MADMDSLDVYDVFNTHPSSNIAIFVAPNDPDRQLRGAGSQARRSAPAMSDERDPNSRQLVFKPNVPFPQFLKLSGQTLGLSSAPRRGFIPLEGMGGFQEIFNVRDLRYGDLVYISSGEAFNPANREHFLNSFDNSGDNGRSHSIFGNNSLARSNSYASSIATVDASHSSDLGVDATISISILGAGGVGKSCITQRLLKGKSWTFSLSHDPTIEDAYRKDLYVDNVRSKLELVDTAGQEEFTSFRHQWMKEKDAYVFAFSLTDRSSLDALDAYGKLHYLLNGVDSNSTKWTPPIILVGNKRDLVDHKPKARQVSAADAEAKLTEWRNLFQDSGVVVGFMSYVETSAKTGNGVIPAFEKLIRSVREMEAKTKKKKSPFNCSFFSCGF